MKLLKFEKKGCGPCKMVQTYLEDKGIEVTNIDAFEIPKTTAMYDVGSVPTLVLVDEEDKELGRSVGFNPEEMDTLIEKMRG